MKLHRPPVHQNICKFGGGVRVTEERVQRLGDEGLQRYTDLQYTEIYVSLWWGR